MDALYKDEQTICALATAAGAGAIAVVRISGLRALEIILLACPGLKKKSIESHHVYFTKIKNDQHENIDEVLITYFENKKSYTGEPSVEISCHGNDLIIQKILNRLYQLGARSAGPGEFTYRAFMNDQIDLVQAEAVLSVIGAQSENALKVSLRQLEGQTSKHFLNIESDIIWCLAHIEASIDFSTEGLDVVDGRVLVEKIKNILNQIEKMIEGYRSGKIIKNGLKIVFMGLPNVGKSSLLNQAVQTDKAIVTNIAGTTRDVIESATIFNGLKINISDTAGIRDTKDVVEKIGVEKSLQESFSADLLMYIFDSSVGLREDDLQLISKFSKQKILFVANKSDQILVSDQIHRASETTKKLHNIYATNDAIHENDILFISALDPDCRNQLLQRVTQEFKNLDFLGESIISSARQFEMSEDAAGAIRQVIYELEHMMGSEYVAQTLKGALLSIQKILGHSFDDQIMDRVFKEFCLGK